MDEKHSEFIKVWVRPTLKCKLLELAEREGRGYSDYANNVLEDHVFGRQRTLCDYTSEARTGPIRTGDELSGRAGAGRGVRR